MSSQPVPVFIILPNTRDRHTKKNTTPQKKPQKDKIPETLFKKQVVTETRRLSLTNFVKKLADVLSATFWQGAKDHIEYKNRTFVYYYCLSIIFKKFNQAELELLFSTYLLLFYNKLDKKRKKELKGVFKLAQHQVE